MDLFNLIEQQKKSGRLVANDLGFFLKMFGQTFKEVEITPYTFVQSFVQNSSAGVIPKDMFTSGLFNNSPLNEFYFGDFSAVIQTTAWTLNNFVQVRSGIYTSSGVDVYRLHLSKEFITNGQYEFCESKDQFFQNCRMHIFAGAGNTYSCNFQFVGVKILLK